MEKIQRIAEEVTNFLDKKAEENNATEAEIVSVLELVKFALLAQAWEASKEGSIKDAISELKNMMGV